VLGLWRLFIKTSLCFFAVGMGLGAYLLVGRELNVGVRHPYLTTAHVHLLLVGGVLHMIMGVAYWMFPRPAQGLPTRYRPGLAVVNYALVTAGTALRAAGEIATGFTGRGDLGPLILAGAAGQLAGALLFVLNIWPRVRGPAWRERTARGLRE
jgi:heme/copper-type cytochrome/quinol oxidase subunit 1